jgi:hypothetical protein
MDSLQDQEMEQAHAAAAQDHHGAR